MIGKSILFKITASGIFSVVISIFGVNYKYIVVLIILMVADTTLGWLKGFKKRDFNTSFARWGFATKIVELELIYILGRLDWAFNTNGLLANVGVFYYGIAELASIIENIHDGGLASLPNGMVDFVRKLKRNAGKMMLDRLYKVVTSAFDEEADVLKDKKGEQADESDKTNDAQ